MYTCHSDGSAANPGIQLIWTIDFQDALTRMARDKDKTVMGAANKMLELAMDFHVGMSQNWL